MGAGAPLARSLGFAALGAHRGLLSSKGQPAGMGFPDGSSGEGPIWGGAQRGRTAAPSPGGLPAPLVRGSRHHPRVEPRSSAASSSSRQGTGFLSELCLLLAADTGLSSGEQREPSYQVQGPWFPSSGGWLICSTSPLVCLWWLSNTSNRCFPVLSRVSNCSLGEVWSPGRSLGQAGGRGGRGEACGQHRSHWCRDEVPGCPDCSSSTFCLSQKMVSLLSREEAGAFVRVPVRSTENK